MNKAWKIVFLLLSIFLGHFAIGKEYRVNVLSKENGLPVSKVNAMAQDSMGYYYLATDQGLFRSDGVHYARFIPEGMDESIEIYDLIQVGGNNLLLATLRGVFQLNTFSATANEIPLPKGQEPFSALRIHPRPEGCFVIGKNNKLYEVLPNDSLRLSIDFPLVSGLRAISIYDVQFDSRGQLWCGTINGLYCFVMSGGNWRLKSSHFEGKGVRALVPVDSGILVLRGLHNPPFILDGQLIEDYYLKGFSDLDTNIKGVRGAYRMGESQWVLSNYMATALIWDRLEQRVFPLKSDLLEIPYQVTNGFYDSYGITWLCTRRGLIRIEPYPTGFSPLNFLVENEKVSVREIFALASDTLIFGTYSGLYYYVPSQDSMYRVDILVDGKRQNLQGLVLYHLYRHLDGRMFLFSESEGVFEIVGRNSNSLSLKPIPIHPDFLFHLFGRSCIPLSMDELLVGSRDGLFRWKLSQKKLIKEDILPEGKSPSVWCLSKQGETIFIGTQQGLFSTTLVDGHFGRLKTEIVKGKINDMSFGPDGGMMVASSEGFFFREPYDSIFQFFGLQHGLLNPYINAIEYYSPGKYWLSTNKGLSLVDLEQKSFINYYEDQGLWMDEFNYGASLTHSSGNLYFGGVEGAVRINQRLPKKDIKNFRLLVSSLVGYSAENNKNRVTTLFGDNFSHDYKPSQRFLEVRFGLNQVMPNVEIQYQYQLKGYDKDWVQCISPGVARYNEIPPGNYSLQLRALHPDGHWVYGSQNFQIQSLPVFYKTWWFWSLIAGCIAFLVFYLLRTHYKHLLKLAEIRTSIASDLHDDLGGLLTSIGVQADLHHLMAENEKSKAAFLKIKSLNQEVVRKVSDVVWSVDARNDNMSSLVERLKQYASTCLGDSMVFRMEVEPSVLSLQFDSFFRQQLFLVLKEVIHNAAKHSNGSELGILMHLEKNYLCVFCLDNGSTFTPKDHQGQGLKNFELRMQRLKGKVKTHFDQGMHHYFKIPLP